MIIKEAGVMLIVEDGLILGISRRHDKTKFGLLGGKVNTGETVKQAAIRETKEEASVTVHDCKLIYHRVGSADSPNGIDFHCYCYYATSWSGIPVSSEEGIVKWLTAADITAVDSAFGEYNRKTLDIFKTIFPDVYIKGE
jgi:8-oxo-dGTP pyrophosphatase MutT (NUDIX family)